MDFDDILRFTNVVFSGLVAGILLAVFTGILPMLRDFPERTGLEMKQRLDRVIDRVNPPAWALSLLSGVLILLVVDDLSTTANVFTIIGVAGSSALGLITGLVNRPINRQMSSWSDESIPPEYHAVMGRWSRMHAARTVCGVLAFGCYVAATLAVVA